MLQSIVGFWSRLWPVLRRTSPILLLVGGIAVSWGIGHGWRRHSVGRLLADEIRYAGTVLQLAGIVLVATGLRDIRREFRRPSIIVSIRRWFSDLRAVFKSRDRTVTVGAAGLALGAATGHAVASVTSNTLEGRVERLEQELKQIRTEAAAQMARIDAEMGTTRAQIRQEAETRATQHAAIQKQLEELAVGGFHLEVIGLVWLLFATLATSIPEELAHWLS